jgi:hypothetical protein
VLVGDRAKGNGSLGVALPAGEMWWIGARTSQTIRERRLPETDNLDFPLQFLPAHSSTGKVHIRTSRRLFTKN